MPPLTPFEVFEPNEVEPFLGKSDIISYEAFETHRLQIPLIQDRVFRLEPVGLTAAGFMPPYAYIWCAHTLSSVIFPEAGFPVELQARQPPPFHYEQLGRSVSCAPNTECDNRIYLTLGLAFAQVRIVWEDDLFSRQQQNYFDDVEFSVTPAAPLDLVVLPKTGELTGMPNEESPETGFTREACISRGNSVDVLGCV